MTDAMRSSVGDATADSPVVAEFCFVFDDEHVRTLFARRKGAAPRSSVAGVAWLGLMALCLVIAAVRDAADGRWTLAWILLAMLAAFGWGWFGLPRAQLAAVRRAPDYGRELRVRVERDGIATLAPSETSVLRWTAFRGWKSCADGILVETRQGGFVWLADARRVTGQRVAVESCLKSSIRAEHVLPR